jgi:hypothetical protein
VLLTGQLLFEVGFYVNFPGGVAVTHHTVEIGKSGGFVFK